MLQKPKQTMTTTQWHFLPGRVVYIPNVAKAKANHIHHPVAFFARTGGGHPKCCKSQGKPYTPPSAHFPFFCVSSQRKIMVFLCFSPSHDSHAGSQNLRRGHHVDIRLDSIKHTCFMRCPSTSGAPSSHHVCLDSKYLAAKSHRIPCELRGSSGIPWASELMLFIAVKCALARFPWLDAAGP